MNRFVTILLVFLTSTVFAQQQKVLTQQEKNSLREVICDIQLKDQAMRDEYALARAGNDSAALASINKEIQAVDSFHFILLDTILRTYGYPSEKLIGEGACNLAGVLTHWSKKYPEWFNDPRLVLIFQREIDNGNLSITSMDWAHYFYIKSNKADINLRARINHARAAYGLLPYTQKQYLGQEKIVPLNNDSEAERRKHGIKIKGQGTRNKG